METIGNVIEWLYSNIFYYEIITDQEIDTEVTEDSLHRHSLDGFNGFDTNGYDIFYHIDDKKWYLSLTLEIGDYNDEYEDLPATSSNLSLITCDCPEMIFDYQTNNLQGKFIIPESFSDDIYPVDLDGNSIKVLFKFAKVENDSLINYIKVMNITD